jgi:hypothetical protein
VAIIIVAVPEELQFGVIGLTGAAYISHTITPWNKCCFCFCNTGDIPRKKLDCRMIVPCFEFVSEGWYQIRGFNDVDKNIEVLKKHCAMGVYGTITMKDYEEIVDAKRSLMPLCPRKEPSTSLTSRDTRKGTKATNQEYTQSSLCNNTKKYNKRAHQRKTEKSKSTIFLF